MSTSAVPRRTRLRARTALLLAPLVLLASSSLGLVLTTPAAAAVGDPVAAPTLLTTPASPSADASPTWTYSLPADGDPVVSVSDSSTVTTTTAHAAECAVTLDGATPAYGTDCGAPAEDGSGVALTSDLAGEGAWTLALRTVRTTTTDTVVQTANGPMSSTDTVVERSQPVTADYVHDASDPVVRLVRTSAADATRVTWSLQVSDATATGADARCSVSGATLVSCGPETVVVDLPGDGTAVLEVAVTDAVGRTTTVGDTVVLDRAQLSIGAPARSGDVVTWPLGDEAFVDVRCTLTDEEGVLVEGGACTPTSYTSPALATTTGTTYVLQVTATDSGGATATVRSAPYLHDSAPDLVVTTRPMAAGRDRQPAWSFTATEPVTVVCTLTGPDGPVLDGACSPGGYVAPLLPESPDASYALSLQVTDGLGNTATVDGGSYRLDTVLVASLTDPASPSGDPRPGWTLVTDEPVLVDCVLTAVADGREAAGTCAATGFRADGLTADGEYALQVTVTDRAGNVAVLDSGTHVHDTGVDVTVTAEAAVVRTSTPRWTIGGEPLSAVQCALTGPDGLLVAEGACTTTSYTAPAVPDGDYALVVAATDLAGNTTTTAPVAQRVDTRVDVTVTTSPRSPGNDRTPRWTLAGETDAVSCVLRVDGAVVDGGRCDATGYTAPELPGTPGSALALDLTVTDAVGNVRVLPTLTAVLDTVLEATVAGPADPGDDPTPSWAVSGERVDVACALTLDGDPVTGGECGPGGYTAPDLGPTTGADLVLRLTLTDAAGNSRTDVLSARLDTVLEAVLVEPASPGNDLTPSWTFTGEAYAAVECVLTGPDGATVVDGACTPTGYTAPELDPAAPGEHVLTATLTDAAGNRAVLTSSPYVLDAGVQLRVVGPTGPSSLRTPAWTFEGEAYVEATCTLAVVGGAEVTSGPCATTGFSAPLLPPTTGTPYALTVSVRDTAGNRATAVSPTYLLDTTAELVVTPPASPDRSRTPRWAIATEPDAAVTCTLVGPAGAVADGSCSTTAYVAPELPETPGASYVLTVRVVDRAGNARETTSPPHLLDTELQLDLRGPAGPGNDTTPVWELAGERYVDLVCTLASGGRSVAGGTCGPTSYAAPELPGGTGSDVVLTVTATDAAGNQRTVTSAVYRLDTEVELTVDGPTGPAPGRTPAWTFRGEPYAAVACTLTGPDGVGITGGGCTTDGYTAPTLVQDGRHALRVTLRDLAGTERTTTVTYELDSLYLTVTGPTGPSSLRTPSWTFDDEPYTSATCVLSGPAGVVSSGACTTTSGFTAPELPGTPGASYVLTVTATDTAGTTGTVPSAPYRLDTRLPVATVSGPTGAGRTGAVTWAVSSDEALTAARCVLRRDGVELEALACPGATAVELTQTGRYDVLVVLTDTAGNVSTTTSAPYAFDAVAPAAPVLTPARTVTSSPDARWDLTWEAGTALTCRLSRDGEQLEDWAPCAGTVSRVLAVDGEHLLEARAADSVGPGEVGRATWRLDRVAPAAPVVSGPVGPSQDRAPVWTFTHEAGTTTCRVLSGELVALASTACPGGTATGPLADQPDGTWVLEVVLTDEAGNRSSARSAGYVLDTTAPTAPVVSGPTGPSASREPTFTFTGESGTAARCVLALDGVARPGVACSSPYSPVLDRDGSWTLAVTLIDAAGGASAPGTSPAYVLDTTAPAAPTVTPPAPTGRVLTPVWSVGAEAGARVECRLSGPAGLLRDWSSCTSPVTTDLTGQPEGSYLLEARGTDAAGNLGAVGSGSYLLDTTPPPPAVVTGPTSPGSATSVAFTFTSPAGTTATCRLTRGGTVLAEPVTCTSPQRVDLAGQGGDGAYVLSVRLTDAAGNTGPGASATYVLDTTAPAAPVLVSSPASPSSATAVQWELRAEAGAVVSCRITGPTGATYASLTPCGPVVPLDLTGAPAGSYVLTATATDAAGSTGAALTAEHVLSPTAPAGPSLTAPRPPYDDLTPVWTISAGSFECQLLDPAGRVLSAWAACSDAYTFNLVGRPDGTYVLQARAPGATAVATSGYRLDTTAPGLARVTAPFSPSTNSTPTWTVASSEEAVTAQCQLTGVQQADPADWAPCAVSPAGAPVTRTLAQDGVYFLAVRLLDPSGLAGSPVFSRYELSTQAPPLVGISGPTGPSQDQAPTFTFVSVATATLECSLATPTAPVAGWAACTSPYVAALDEDGVYTLSVRALSPSGTAGPEEQVTYTLDTTAPLTPVLLEPLPPAQGQERALTYRFTVDPDPQVGYTCTVRREGVDPRAFGPCDRSGTVDAEFNRADGNYTVTVTATDAAGNRSSVETVYSLRTTPAPVPVFTLEPGSPSSSERVEWRYSVVTGSTAQCRVLLGTQLLDGSWRACGTATVLDLTGRPSGTYELQVRSSIATGDTSIASALVASRYVLDRTALPLPGLVAAPAGFDDDRTPRWAFTGVAGTVVECRPSPASPFQPCSTPAPGPSTGGVPAGELLLTLTADGPVEVAARLAAPDGARGPLLTGDYVLDTVAPGDVDLVGPPSPGDAGTASWTWSQVAYPETTLCRFTTPTDATGTEAPCHLAGDTRTGLTRDGAYALTVTAVDQAGNRSGTDRDGDGEGDGSTAVYVLDTTPPTAAVLRSPFVPQRGTARRTTWTFEREDDTTALCSVSNRAGQRVLAPTPCSGGTYVMDLTGLPLGEYRLTVLVEDRLGRSTRTTMNRSYVLEAPSSPLVGGGAVPPPAGPRPPVVRPPGGGTPAGPGLPGGAPAAPDADPLVRRPIVRPDSTPVPPRPASAGPVAPAGDRVRGLQEDDGAPAGTTPRVQPGAPVEPAPDERDPRTDPRADIGLDDLAVPRAIRDTVTQTLAKPTLPLALLAIVFLFLVAQNRIDRRDPKLAAAPLEAEPELDFQPFRPQTGGAP